MISSKYMQPSPVKGMYKNNSNKDSTKYQSSKNPLDYDNANSKLHRSKTALFDSSSPINNDDSYSVQKANELLYKGINN